MATYQICDQVDKEVRKRVNTIIAQHHHELEEGRIANLEPVKMEARLASNG